MWILGSKWINSFAKSVSFDDGVVTQMMIWEIICYGLNAKYKIMVWSKCCAKFFDYFCIFYILKNDFSAKIDKDKAAPVNV